LRLALSYAPNLVCADGAANALLDHTPNLIIGDLDSLEDQAGWSARLGGDLIHDADQDSTDFEKCLVHVAAPFIIGIGFLGGRIDHELATLNAMTMADRPIILIGGKDVVFAPRSDVTFSTAPSQRVSIFPLAPLSARSVGLKWPLDGLTLAPSGRIATSNEATSDSVTLCFDIPGALVILPRGQLAPALTAMGVIKDG
jgi:thiamine pyrophosphokinase